MRPRAELHRILEGIVGRGRTYFQPPPKVSLTYPCIVYHRSDINSQHADNLPYRLHKRYQVTVIDRDPDSGIPDKVALLESSRFVRHYTADNLNHDVFEIYY